MENLSKFGVKEMSYDSKLETEGGFLAAFAIALGAGYIIGQAVGYAVKAYNE